MTKNTKKSERRKIIKLSLAQTFLSCLHSMHTVMHTEFYLEVFSLPWRFCLLVPGGRVGTSQFFTGKGGQARTGAGVRLKGRILIQVLFPGGLFSSGCIPRYFSQVVFPGGNLEILPRRWAGGPGALAPVRFWFNVNVMEGFDSM